MKTKELHFLNARVCQDFCVNGQVLFLGWAQGKGVPSPAHRCSSVPRCHCETLSKAGIRSGHRIVKWFNASRQ